MRQLYFISSVKEESTYVLILLYLGFFFILKKHIYHLVCSCVGNYVQG